MSIPTWQIVSLKYDQRPHYTWPATLIEDNGDQIRLSSVVGGMLVHYTRGFSRPQSHPSDLTFWRDRWYNVFTNYDEQNQLHHFYCNITMPPIIQPQAVTFVDLDLDVIVNLDGTYRIVDQDEFIQHGIQFGYPDFVQKRAAQALREVIALVQNAEGPFEALKSQST